MKKLGVLLVLVVLMALAPAVLAGGWATVTLDEPPGEIHAGQTWSVGLTVLQHGVTPVHNLGEGFPVEPTFVATNAATGERIEAVARPAEEIGRFTLEVTFPSDGEWEWTIFPAPLAGDDRLESLTVLPPLPVVAATDLQATAFGNASLPAAIGIAALVIALGLVPWLATRQGRKVTPSRLAANTSPHKD